MTTRSQELNQDSAGFPELTLKMRRSKLKRFHSKLEPYDDGSDQEINQKCKFKHQKIDESTQTEKCD